MVRSDIVLFSSFFEILVSVTKFIYLDLAVF